MKNNKPIRANLLALTVFAFLAPVNPAFAQQSEDVRKSREAAAMTERNAADERRAMLRSAVDKDAKMRAMQKAEMMAEEARKSRAAAALTQRNIAASRRALLGSAVKRQAKAEAKMAAAKKAKMMAQEARKARISAAAAELKAADERRAMLKAAIEKQAMADTQAKVDAETKAAALAEAKAKAEEQRQARAAALAAAQARRKSQAEAAARNNAAEKQRMVEAEAAQLASRQAANCQIKFREIRNNKTIKFAIGSANLSTRDTDTLDVLVVVVKSCPAAKIAIEGHTDSSGPANNNLRLSQRRAAAVMNYIVKAGVSKDRLSSLGHGESQPIASNTTDEGRRKNRRIEFLVK